jgi:hypothetical protein
MTDRYNSLVKAAIENDSAVIPIIGTKIDKGSFGIVILAILSLTLFLLRLSLINELSTIKSLERLFTEKTSEDKIVISSLILNNHVFSGLTIGWRPNITWVLLFIPVAAVIYQVIDDVRTSSNIIKMLLDGSTTARNIFYTIEILVSLMFVISCVTCYRAAHKLDNELDQLPR